jgi:hypothetical protein
VRIEDPCKNAKLNDDAEFVMEMTVSKEDKKGEWKDISKKGII